MPAVQGPVPLLLEVERRVLDAERRTQEPWHRGRCEGFPLLAGSRTMKAAALTVVTLVAVALCASWAGPQQPSLHLPWKEAGLTEREAAAHLLNRFSYGPRPGEIEKVIDMGLDRWLERRKGGAAG